MSDRILSRENAAVLAAAIVTSGVLALLIRPFTTGPVGFDSAASVIHFDRIVAGQHLEAFVTATPKPLLTVVYGLTHAIVPDWRLISWEAIGSFGVAVALAAMLLRLVVPSAPAVLALPLVCVALLGSRQLVLDVGAAYAVSWALIGWLAAAIGAAMRPPRAWLVGLGLLLATLARLETSVIIALVAAAAIVRAVRPAKDPGPDTWTARRLATVAAIGAAALPIMLVHDWLLTGDPLFWSTVSSVYSRATAVVPTPAEVAANVWDVFAARPVATVMAIVGVLGLVRARNPVAFGILALSGGVAALTVVLAARGTYVSTRYYAAIEIALLVAAVIGVCLAAAWIERIARARLSPRAARPVAAALIGGLAALTVFGGPFAPLDTPTRSGLNRERRMAMTSDLGVPVIAPLLADLGLSPGQAAPPDAHPWLIGPALLRPRLAVDLDLPLWAVGRLNPTVVAPDGSGLLAGQVILHSGRYDRPEGAYDVLETTETTHLGPRELSPVAQLPLDAWVLEVR